MIVCKLLSSRDFLATFWLACAIPLLAIPPAEAPAEAMAGRAASAAPVAPVVASLLGQYQLDATTDRGLSNLVDRWSDASGNGNHLYLALLGETAPVFDWHGLNGMPALRFDGTDRLANLAVMPTASYTVYAAVAVDQFVGDQLIFGGGAFGGFELGFYGGSNFLSLRHHGAVLATSTVAAAPQTALIVRASYDASTSAAVVAVDGVANGGFGAPLTAAGLQVGAAGTTANGLTGFVAEAALFDDVLTPAEIALFDLYFAFKYQSATAPDVEFLDLLLDGAIVPRDVSANTASLGVAGVVKTQGFNSVKLEILRDGVVHSVATQPLSYVAGQAAFAVAAYERAGLYDYDLLVKLDNGVTEVLVKVVENIAIGDVILVNGQSNAVAGNSCSETIGNQPQSDWIRTFGSQSALAPPQQPNVTMDLHWDVADGLRAVGHGTVGSMALQLGSRLMQDQGVPIALINGAVGGTRISEHQRRDTDPQALDTIYGRLLYRASMAKVAAKACAMVWYQGESDGLQWAAYPTDFLSLYVDWFADYPLLETIAVVQTRLVTCQPTGLHVPEFLRLTGDLFPKVATMSATAVPGFDGCHFCVAGYWALADRLANLLNRDLYGGPDLDGIDPPNVLQVRWTSTAKTAIEVEYRNQTEPLTLESGAEQFFVLDDPTVSITSAALQANVLTLSLSAPSTATVLSYEGPQNSTGAQPWLVNESGVGAFTFLQQPIQ